MCRCLYSGIAVQRKHQCPAHCLNGESLLLHLSLLPLGGSSGKLQENHSQQTLCKSTTQMHCCSWTRACANSREIVFPVIHRLSFPSSRSCFFFTSAPVLNLGHRRCSILPSGLSFIRFTMFLCSNSNHKLLTLNATLLETLSKGLWSFLAIAENNVFLSIMKN